MAVLGSLNVAFGITVLVCLSSAVQTSMKVTTSGNTKNIPLHSNHLDFTVSTCSEAYLHMYMGTPKRHTKYVLKMNHGVTQDPNQRRFVLQRNVAKSIYTTVMSLNQSKNLCGSTPEWFSVRIDNGLLIISEPCKQRKHFTWPVNRSNTKSFLGAMVYSPREARWHIAEHPMCNPSTIPRQGFLKAQSIKLRTNKTQRRILNNHGFEFNDTGTTLKINLQSCDLALMTFGESKEGLYHEYYELFLNKHIAEIKTNTTILRRCKERKCTTIGSVAPSTAIQSCHGVQTFFIVMKPGEIGVGFACNKNSGLKWKIDRNFKVRFVGLLSTSPNTYAEWDISFNSCQAPFRMSRQTTLHHVTVGHHETGTPPQPTGHKPGVHVNPPIANSASNGSAMARTHEADKKSRGNKFHNTSDVTASTDPRPAASGGVTSRQPDGKDDEGMKGNGKDKQEMVGTTQQPGGVGTSRNSGWSPVMSNAEAWISVVLLPLTLHLLIDV